MVNLMTQLSRYLLIILAAVYAMKCFTVFRSKHAWDRGSVYMTQNILMFFIHFVCYLLIFLNERTLAVLAFYIFQVAFFIVTLGLYSSIYKHASRLLVNNMCFLMMIGFVMLTRLDFDLAIRQFCIAVAGVAVALVIPVIIAKVRTLERFGIVYGVLCLLVLASVFVVGRSANGATTGYRSAPSVFSRQSWRKLFSCFLLRRCSAAGRTLSIWCLSPFLPPPLFLSWWRKMTLALR